MSQADLGLLLDGITAELDEISAVLARQSPTVTTPELAIRALRRCLTDIGDRVHLDTRTRAPSA